MNMTTPSRVAAAARLSSAYSALLKWIISPATPPSSSRYFGKRAMAVDTDVGRCPALPFAVLGCEAAAERLPFLRTRFWFLFIGCLRLGLSSRRRCSASGTLVLLNLLCMMDPFPQLEGALARRQIVAGQPVAYPRQRNGQVFGEPGFHPPGFGQAPRGPQQFLKFGFHWGQYYAFRTTCQHPF